MDIAQLQGSWSSSLIQSLNFLLIHKILINWVQNSRARNF